MRRTLLAITVTALALTGCSSQLGAVVPECDRASGTMVLAVQSVPGSRYVSCIEALPVGWEYQDLTARSGKSQYLIDSDRMGDGFLRVENLLACDVGDADLVAEPVAGVELWKDVEARITVQIALVPEGPTETTSQRAVELFQELDDVEIEGREVVVTPSVSDETTSDRIERALDQGAHAVIISIRDAEEGTLGVRLLGSETEVTVAGFDELVELLEDTETESSYVGSWFYVFDGGCVRYVFDAEGPGTATLDRDVETALGLYDAEELRQVARDLGFEIP